MSGETALRERAQLLDELRQIVQSMKNLAFAELQRVSRMKQAQTLAGEALSQGLQRLPPPTACDDARPASQLTWLVIGAERGFCGAFNTPLVQAVNALRAQDPAVPLLIASHRLQNQLNDAHLDTITLPGCSASEEAEHVLETWLDAVHQAIHAGDQVWVIHVGNQGLVRQPLWPVPLPRPRLPSPPPQMYLPATTLRDALNRQWLRLALQGALYASLEQENHWRLAQMQRAQDHLDALGRTLHRRYAALRQANITNELETLASSTMATLRC